MYPCGCCWDLTPEDRKAPLAEDAPCTGNVRKKGKGRWCKGRVGVPHRVIYKAGTTNGSWRSRCYRYVCEDCGKSWWGRRPKTGTKAGTVVQIGGPPPRGLYPERDDHYSYTNIWKRLDGKPCECRDCNAKA